MQWLQHGSTTFAGSITARNYKPGAMQWLMLAFGLFRLDYYNAVLTHFPSSSQAPLHRVLHGTVFLVLILVKISAERGWNYTDCRSSTESCSECVSLCMLRCWADFRIISPKSSHFYCQSVGGPGSNQWLVHVSCTRTVLFFCFCRTRILCRWSTAMEHITMITIWPPQYHHMFSF